MLLRLEIKYTYIAYENGANSTKSNYLCKEHEWNYDIKRWCHDNGKWLHLQCE